MFFLTTVGGVLVGDIIVQLFFLLILIALVAVVITLIVKSKDRNKKLNRIEEKIDKLLSDKNG
ncbi:hypothetical protein M3210_19870 [Oceanobacillus luteolus]|uniref:hypothetical protein n=1 Tax=Oceanobacillus luteolus TaxID=1274358 RepID=UPI00204109E7|nr:hypothetical protein [Oceanobacillus luteolus]MCM3742451.1 hypothetical protein [Oceanobacillus luteolus]